MTTNINMVNSVDIYDQSANKKYFRRDNMMVEDLINYLSDYKTTTSYQGVDLIVTSFDNTKCCGEETKLFGPVSVKDLPKQCLFKKLNQK